MTTTGDGQERYVDPARRYALGSRIATGGMGEVWRGRDTVLDRPVAVKLLKSEYADDPAFRARFETEARHAAALHHPNVAAVFDFGESPALDGSGTPRPYLVMELVDGQPLSALLRPGDQMAPAAVTGLLAQAADAIGAAHAAGIVHRDVKPANLLVTPGRQVKITDFGIARATEGMALTQTGQVMGTPQYLAPEQARGEAATPASDVYALGVVAFECLAGRRPFEGSTQVATALAHIREPVPDLPGDVPTDLATVVRACLAKDPADRFPDGAALAAALRDPATGATAVLGAATPTDHTSVLPGAGAAGAAGVAGVAGAAGIAGAAGAAGGAPTAAQPVTRTTEPPTGPAGGAATGDPGGRRGTAALWAAILVVAAIIVVLLVTQLGGDDDEPTVPATTPTTDAPPLTPSATEDDVEEATVFVDEDDYLGRPVDEVEAELRDLGLRVRTDEVENPGDADEGAVTSVDPSGDLVEGDEVVVAFFGPAPEEEPEEEPVEPTEPAEPTTPAEPTEPSTPVEPTEPTGSPDAGGSTATPSQTASGSATGPLTGGRR